MKTLMVFALSVLAPAILAAQGSGGVSPSGVGGGGTGGIDNSAFEVTKTIKLRLIAIPKDGTILVAEDNGVKRSVKLDKKLRIRADKDTEFAGKKNITQDDLQPGMLLKITYRASDFVALELRILKAPAKA